MKTKLLKKVKSNVWIEYNSVDNRYRIYVKSRLTNSVLEYDNCTEKQSAFRRYRSAVRWYCGFYFFQKNRKNKTITQIKHAEK